MKNSAKRYCEYVSRIRISLETCRSSSKSEFFKSPLSPCLNPQPSLTSSMQPIKKWWIVSRNFLCTIPRGQRKYKIKYSAWQTCLVHNRQTIRNYQINYNKKIIDRTEPNWSKKHTVPINYRTFIMKQWLKWDKTATTVVNQATYDNKDECNEVTSRVNRRNQTRQRQNK